MGGIVTATGGIGSAGYTPSATAVAEATRNSIPPQNARDVAAEATNPAPVKGNMRDVSEVAAPTPGTGESGRILDISA